MNSPNENPAQQPDTGQQPDSLRAAERELKAAREALAAAEQKLAEAQAAATANESAQSATQAAGAAQAAQAFAQQAAQAQAPQPVAVGFQPEGPAAQAGRQQAGYWDQATTASTAQPKQGWQQAAQPGWTQAQQAAPNSQAGFQPQAAAQQQGTYQQQTGYQQPHYAAPLASRDHVAAGLLAIFLGGFGVHKFYLGYSTQGFVLLALSLVGGLFSFGLITGVVWIVGIVEGIIYLTKSQSEFERVYVHGKREWF